VGDAGSVLTVIAGQGEVEGVDRPVLPDHLVDPGLDPPADLFLDDPLEHFGIWRRGLRAKVAVFGGKVAEGNVKAATEAYGHVMRQSQGAAHA
jgi:hypothetical protein